MEKKSKNKKTNKVLSPNPWRLFYINYEQSLLFGEARRTSKEKIGKKQKQTKKVNSLAYSTERWE